MKRTFMIIFGCFAAACILTFTLLWNGVLKFNNPSKAAFPVRGVDVSHYQGEIDWPTLASQGIDFAFIKATEGSTYTDDYFSDNFALAHQTGLRVGAYHFFSFDSEAASQAANFISTVEPFDSMLPPVVDFEFYGDKKDHPPAKGPTVQSLQELLNLLEAHYGVKPILYATEKAYDLYLAGGFEDYDIWIRNILKRPRLSDGRSFTFWQYTDRETLDGYKGEEKFIDMNVFNGTEAEFQQYGRR